MFTFPQHGIKGFLGDSDGKAYACNGGDQASIPGSERFLEEGNGNPLQYSAWRIPWTEEQAGYNPWGCKESNTTERLSLQVSTV